MRCVSIRAPNQILLQIREDCHFFVGLLECMTNEHNAFAIRLLQEAQFHVVRL